MPGLWRCSALKAAKLYSFSPYVLASLSLLLPIITVIASPTCPAWQSHGPSAEIASALSCLTMTGRGMSF